MLKKFIALLRPHADQYMCEKRVKNIMTRLKVEDFHFNWDRNSCYIEFQYQEQSYRMEHSVEKAKEKVFLVQKWIGLFNGVSSYIRRPLSYH